jgi:hypothetical protein
MRLVKELWNDDCGALIAAEYLFIVTILIIGIIVGLAGLREAIVIELTETGNAILALSQGFTISGMSFDGGDIDGSQATDLAGILADPTYIAPSNPTDIDVAQPLS